MPPPVITQERTRGVNPAYTALQQPWKVAEPTHINHQISRRDFLKLGLAALGAVAGASMLPESVLAMGDEGNQQPQYEMARTASFRELLSTESQEFLRNHNIHTIIYEGRTTSLDDAKLANDMAVSAHMDLVVRNLRGIEQSGTRPANIPGYTGDVTPSDMHLSFDNTTIMIDKTEKGQLITQTTIEKRSSNNLPELAANLIDLRKSVMITLGGKEDKVIWMDNHKSQKIFEGITSEIVVDTKRGSVFQTTYSPKNILAQLVQTINQTLQVERLSDSGDALKTVFLPNSGAFVLAAKDLYNSVRDRFSPQQAEAKMEEIFSKLFSKTATPESRRSMYLEMGGDPEKMGLINDMFQADLPVNMDLALKMVGSYRYILENIDTPEKLQAFLKNTTDQGIFFALFPTIRIPEAPNDTDAKVQRATEAVLRREVHLPYAIPQLHIIQMRRGTETKQVLVARYSATDMSTLNAGTTTVMPGENLVYIGEADSMEPGDVFGYGLFNDYDKKTLMQQFRSISPNDYTTLNTDYFASGKFRGWQFDGAAGILEAKNDAVRLYYDPAANGSKLFAGIELPTSGGNSEGKIAELRPGSIWSEKYTHRSKYSNRPTLFTGAYPYSIMDVTEKVIQLRKEGYTSASQFGFLSPPEAAQMMFGLTNKVDYANLERFMGTASAALIQNGNPGFLQSAHSVVISQGETRCTHYKIETKSKWFGLIQEKTFVPQGSEVVNPNMLLRAYEIKEVNGKPMVVVANADDGTFYAVPEEQMQFVGVDSDMLLDLQNAITIAALVWGGYRVLSSPTIGNALQSLSKTLTKAIFK